MKNVKKASSLKEFCFNEIQGIELGLELGFAFDAFWINHALFWIIFRYFVHYFYVCLVLLFYLYLDFSARLLRWNFPIWDFFYYFYMSSWVAFLFNLELIGENFLPKLEGIWSFLSISFNFWMVLNSSYLNVVKKLDQLGFLPIISCKFLLNDSSINHCDYAVRHWYNLAFVY